MGWDLEELCLELEMYRVWVSLNKNIVLDRFITFHIHRHKCDTQNKILPYCQPKKCPISPAEVSTVTEGATYWTSFVGSKLSEIRKFLSISKKPVLASSLRKCPFVCFASLITRAQAVDLIARSPVLFLCEARLINAKIMRNTLQHYYHCRRQDANWKLFVHPIF